ncbi:hypothetical protein ABIE44_001426 [Marmoricola sp. OAE513]
MCCPDDADRCTVDERVDLDQRDRATGRQGRGHRRCSGRLHAVEPGARVRRLQESGQAGEQATATDRGDDGVGSRTELVEDLEGDGALAGDRARVVERGDQGRTGLLGVRHGCGEGVLVGVADDDHLDHGPADREDPLALLARGRTGHEDPTAGAEPVARESDSLRVVAGAGAHDTSFADLGVELHDEVVGAADLVGAHHLKVLALEPHLMTGGLGQPRAELQRGTCDDVGEPRSGGLDVGDGDGNGGRHGATTLSRGPPVIELAEMARDGRLVSASSTTG